MPEIAHELIPIVLMACITIMLVAIAVIINIRARKSRVGADESDFIDKVVAKKKRQLSVNIGGLNWTTYVGLLIMCPLALGAISYMMLTQKVFCLVFAAIGLFVPETIVRVMANNQKKLYDEQYARALRSLGSSLRAGMSIEQAIDAVGQNPFVNEQIRKGFRQISSDLKVGLSVEEAFTKFANRTNSMDAMDVAAAISMQAKVGGSEAKVITSIAQNINDRLILRKEIKSLFAETSVLVTVMDFIPFAVFIMLYFTAYQLVSVFFESFAMTMLLIAIMVFTTVGSFIIHKMLRNAKGG